MKFYIKKQERILDLLAYGEKVKYLPYQISRYGVIVTKMAWFWNR